MTAVLPARHPGAATELPPETDTRTTSVPRTRTPPPGTTHVRGGPTMTRGAGVLTAPDLADPPAPAQA
jgi:hypothetical protein